MSTKAFVVTVGSYSDCTILATFSSRDKAVAFVRAQIDYDKQCVAQDVDFGAPGYRELDSVQEDFAIEEVFFDPESVLDWGWGEIPGAATIDPFAEEAQQ